MPMISRERVVAALNHRETDRSPVDFSGHRSSGIAAIAYPKLREYLDLPLSDTPGIEFKGLEKKQHNLRLVDSLWKALRLRSYQEKRSASAIVEQLLRAYYGLQLPPQLAA